MSNKNAQYYYILFGEKSQLFERNNSKKVKKIKRSLAKDFFLYRALADEDGGSIVFVYDKVAITPT